MAASEQHKARGNAHFFAGELEEAVAEFSKAIIQSPLVSTYYTNRALCYLKLKRFEQALADCEKATGLDANSVKGHYFTGLALLELDRSSSAVPCLKFALKLSQEQKLSYTEEIAKQLLRARKKKWDQEEAIRLSQKSELHMYLSDLIAADRKRQLAEVDANPNLSDEEARQRRELIERSLDNRLSELQQMMEQAEERNKKREVPDYLFGNINFEIMKDPVITPSGVTYDRASILEHLHRVGHFDPVTRAKLTEAQLIPNLVMKEVIDSFMEKNGWAGDF